MQTAASREIYNRMTPPERDYFRNAGGAIIESSQPVQQKTGAQRIDRATFDAMNPQERAACIHNKGVVVDPQPAHT